jgi:AraC family transcriptional regulator
MQPRIEILNEKKLIGRRIKMSLNEDKTFQLFQSFSPRIKEIENRIGTNLYCLRIYDDVYFHNFSLDNKFEKWASIEVSDFLVIPNEMESFTLESGMYAVFSYKGLHTNTTIFQYIFETWLPNSKYSLANRPHFEILGKKYKNDDANSEEEIWLPIL